MRAQEAGSDERAKARTVSHFMSVATAVKLLREQHCEADALKLALQEQRKARRARSKRRFVFWGEVANQIDN